MHVVYVCVRGPSESRRITVNHRVVWHIVLTFALLDVCFLCVFMAVVAVCCETLATRLYLKIGSRFGSLRVGMCVLSLCSLVCLLSLLSDVCYAIFFLSVWQRQVLRRVDMISA